MYRGGFVELFLQLSPGCYCSDGMPHSGLQRRSQRRVIDRCHSNFRGNRVRPPSTIKEVPVICDDNSEAKNNAA